MKVRLSSTWPECKEPSAVDFDDLEGTRKFGEISAYNQSKLANVLFT